MLRSHLGHPLPDLVAEVRRLLGVDCRGTGGTARRPEWAGTEQLDAFADVVSGYAERAIRTDSVASVDGLLAYLDAATVVENGLAPAQAVGRAEPGPGADRARRQGSGMAGRRGSAPVRRAVPVDRAGAHLAHRRRRSAAAIARRPVHRGRARRASAGHLGRRRSKAAVGHDRRAPRQLDQRRLDEERRLLYVAITRCRRQLLLSGHHWGTTGIKPRGPSDFLLRAQRRHRRVRRRRRALRHHRAVGVRAGSPAIETRCATAFMK